MFDFEKSKQYYEMDAIFRQKGISPKFLERMAEIIRVTSISFYRNGMPIQRAGAVVSNVIQGMIIAIDVQFGLKPEEVEKMQSSWYRIS